MKLALTNELIDNSYVGLLESDEIVISKTFGIMSEIGNPVLILILAGALFAMYFGVKCSFFILTNKYFRVVTYNGFNFKTVGNFKIDLKTARFSKSSNFLTYLMFTIVNDKTKYRIAVGNSNMIIKREKDEVKKLKEYIVANL